MQRKTVKRVTKSATFLYKIGTHSIIYYIDGQQKKAKKTSLIKINCSLNNKAIEQNKFNQKNKVTHVRQQKQNIQRKKK